MLLSVAHIVWSYFFLWKNALQNKAFNPLLYLLVGIFLLITLIFAGGFVQELLKEWLDCQMI